MWQRVCLSRSVFVFGLWIAILFSGGLLLTQGVDAASYYVGTTADVENPSECTIPGNLTCSLRSAITLANAQSESTVFIPAGTYLLSPESGPLPTITETMHVQGAGPDATIIDAQERFRLFNIEPSTADTTVTIEGLTVTNGYENSEDARGAGIRWNASHTTSKLHLLDLHVTNNQVDGTASRGGGLGLEGGSVRIERNLINRNTAFNGGGIGATDVDLTLKESLVLDNFAPQHGGGVYITDSNTHVADSEIAGNKAYLGAGIHFERGDLRIERAIIQTNKFNESRGRPLPAAGGGPGMFAGASSVIVSDSVFKENEGAGAFLSSVNAQFFRTTVEGNTYGGVYIIGDLLFDSGAAINNQNYGGIFHSQFTGSITVRNSTIVANHGHGIFGDNATVINSTVTDNHTDGYAGLYLFGDSHLYNTIVVNNFDDGVPNDIWVQNPFSPGDAAHNLIGDTASANAAGIYDGEHGNIVSVDPLLGPLVDGGAIPVRPLLPGSPAIDAGDNEYLGDMHVDQRGAPRIVNGVVDMGAFEYRVPPHAGLSTITAQPTSMTAGGTSTITVKLKDGNGTRIVGGGDDVELQSTHGTLSKVTDHGDGTYSATLSAINLGTVTITGSVNGVPITDSAKVTVGMGSPTTFYVGTTADVDDYVECRVFGNMTCSLRSAIMLANVHPGSTVIIPAGTYLLSHELGPLPTITETMHIQGAGPETTIIDAQKHFRVLNVEPSAEETTVTIEGLTVTRGRIHEGTGIRWYSASGTSELHLRQPRLSTRRRYEPRRR